jgi:hypothetical protein
MEVCKVERESDSETHSEDHLSDMKEEILPPPFALAEVKCEIMVSCHMTIFEIVFVVPRFNSGRISTVNTEVHRASSAADGSSRSFLVFILYILIVLTEFQSRSFKLVIHVWLIIF